MSAQLIPALQSPLPEERQSQLARLVDGLDARSLWWLSGYTAGLASSHPLDNGHSPEISAVTSAAPSATVLYGSQTGNAKRVAERLARDIEASGRAVRLVRADAFPIRELKNEKFLYLVFSTQGDGDPPDDSRALFEHLFGKRAPQLKDLRYAVLGLGDSSYPLFNAIGRRLDERLSELGAQRLFDRGEADLDIDTIAAPWSKRALDSIRENSSPATSRGTVVPLRSTPASGFDRDRPFAAEVLANQRITARGSNKDIRHLELSLEGSGLSYEPGDAIGIWPRNSPTLVDRVLETLELDGESAVSIGEKTHSLRDWLLSQRELTRLSRPFIASHAAHAKDAALNRMLAPDQSDALARLLGEQQLIDLLRAYPGQWSAEEFVATLRPLTPRLYSISSSRKIVGDEAHLTVAHVAWNALGIDHQGAASGFLANAGDDVRIPLYIEANERFHLPSDTSRDVIMIGPGTGVAPFRGFVQERGAIGASGRNWLLFGNPHFHSDFLYQIEWQEALREGRLDRLDLAFSRDQETKIHVQHRLREQGRELYAWLENGAHLYVCGDATRMAKDVHAALISVIAEHGGRDLEQASEYLDQLQQSGRYARDVY